MTKEERLLKKLRALHGRREYHAWRLGDVDRQITEATRALAAVRGVVFLRNESVLQEVSGR